MKKLSINLPSADSSTNSLLSSLSPPQSALDLHPFPTSGPRRPPILSLPNTTVAPTLHRKDEDGSLTVPYLDGPIQVLPGIWLGSEDNARDWPALVQRRIKAILNVAKEINSPFDASPPQPLRQFASTPNLGARAREPESTYYPPHLLTGRPGIHYLKLQWSHGERHLVSEGFPTAMAFVDAALARNEGVLIHCQCGVSRSATLMIAIVMRAAATRSPFVPQEVWELRGMQAAYSFVKEKSKHVGPNMSLIYQLLDYEKVLQGGNASPTQSDKSSSISDEEKEWGRRRDAFAAEGYEDRDSDAVQQEAMDLDRAMEVRVIARRPLASSTCSGIGLSSTTQALNERKRAGSVASIRTSCGSVLSENLVEADEEAELLGVGGGFDDTVEPRRSPSLSSESPGSPSDSDSQLPLTFNNFPARPFPVRRHLMSAPSASPTKLTLPVTRQSVVRASTKVTSSRVKRRPPTFGVLPPVPPSPVTPVAVPIGDPPPRPPRKRSSRKYVPPSLKLPDTSSQVTFPSKTTPRTSISATQTLFVFPPSPTVTTAARTPATMTATPRVAMASSKGRTISFIGVGSSAATHHGALTC
ncbi:phosphatases II [Pisolithus marmoratus]|nr:phosphatases II [Pisolithus marmoratus]